MRSLLCATVFALTLTACGQQESTQEKEEPGSAAAEEPAVDAASTETADNVPPVAAAARKALAESLGISDEEVVVLETRSVAWPSAALGCPDPDKMYAQVITPGWFIRLAVGRAEYRYHAGAEGDPFMCPPARVEPGVEMSED